MAGVDFAASERTHVEFVSEGELPAEHAPPLEEIDLAPVLPPGRQTFKVTTWPTGLVEVEKASDPECP